MYISLDNYSFYFNYCSDIWRRHDKLSLWSVYL